MASCYALPYGIFGFTCWTLSLLSNFFIIFGNLPLFTPWLWRKEVYESQSIYFAFIASLMTIGPAIYTCIRCHEEWILIILAVGQLSPWAFKMINDAEASKSNYLDRDYFYLACGIPLTILLSITGWTGLIALIIKLEHTQYAVNHFIFILLASFLFLICIPYVKGDSKKAIRYMICYVAATTHLIGTHYILGKISGDFSGLKSSGVLSALIFFVGKRLLFLDISCNC
ncbi:3569_t:CDS:1 [Dentiscutata erythropus]|uniref:3569_t:CDS:1 n=1 Tax=Dentiscutata erythropus TaxID=1348616 RepID=A0A9N9EB88_9GLOM|nr:3569_t:CDS:1 [Dentiscutata erythropus]